MSIDTDRLVRVYVKMRNARSELKQQFEAKDDEIKAQMDKIEALLLHHLNQTNSDSVRTEHGTFYRQEEVIPNASDWAAFHEWIKKNDAFDALERRIKRTFVTDYMEARKDSPPEEQLPPGVSIFRRYVCRVRKSSS